VSSDYAVLELIYAVNFAGRNLIVENNTEKRAVDFQPTVVVNKS
jgi:hypothetical protein